MLHWSDFIPFGTWTPARYHNSWNKINTSQEIWNSNRVASIHLVFRDQISFHLKKRHITSIITGVVDLEFKIIDWNSYPMVIQHGPRSKSINLGNWDCVFYYTTLPLLCSSFVHSRVDRFYRFFIDQIPFHLGPDHLLGIMTHEIKLLQVKKFER